jgi:hypothetical protein
MDELKFTTKERSEAYDKLFRRAVGGDKEALAALNHLLLTAEGQKQYSLLEDIRQDAYAEYLDEQTPPTVKQRIIDFFKGK